MPRDRETERQRDGMTERQTEQTERQGDRRTRQGDRETEGERVREAGRQRETSR